MQLNDLPPGPGQKIIRAKDAELWNDGFRFLSEVKAVHAAEYARGFAEGKAAGVAEAAALVNKTTVAIDRYIASLDQDIAALAVRIVRRVLGEFDASDLIAKAAVQALAEFRREKTLKVSVHPSSVDAVRSAIAAHIRGTGLGITVAVDGDASLAKDACVVASDFAVIDASIDTQVNALAKAVSTAAVERRGNSG
jgi:type III secretion protein L